MATTRERPPVRGAGGAPGSVGVIVLGCCAVWALISSALGQGRPEGVLLAVLAVVAGYACGRIGGSAVPAGAAVALALAAGAAAAVSATGTGAGGGRAGEVAALLALAQGAACCAACALRTGGGRAWPARLLAVAVVVLAAVLGSPAGCAATAAVALCALGAAAAHGRGRGPVLLVCAVVAAAAVAGVCAVAHGALSAEGAVPTQRVAVWHEAVALAREHPVTGAGPDRFAELGPTAVRAAAPDGEAHSAPLQEAAEQGVVGLALLAGVYVWMLYGLARSPRTTPVAVSAGAALTCLAVLASASDALSFAPVAAAAGALAGLGTADPAPPAAPFG